MSVSPLEALDKIFEVTSSTSTHLLPIESVLGLSLAQDVYATHNLPPFDNSAMDGYAVRLADAGKSTKVVDIIFAGDNKNIDLHDGICTKIMTGAKIPNNCECIVPIEDTKMDGDDVILPKDLVLNKHIRRSGEDIQKKDLLLSSGDTLKAHNITLLASQGISHVKVHKKPLVAVFASGSELKMHFENLEPHQLYNTNTPTILARCTELGCDTEFIGTSEDNLVSIKEDIASALGADLIITSGGVSVGDADFTKEAFEAFDIEYIFEKIDIKPGKPTIFGKIKDTYILNLPGNPLAAAMIFELFGRSIINALSGRGEKYINPIKTKISSSHSIRAGRITMLPGFFDGDGFKVCEKFAPGMVSPLSISNAYIIANDTQEQFNKNDEVKVILNTYNFSSKVKKDIFS